MIVDRAAHLAPLFRAAETCDRCVEPATALVLLRDGGELRFCAEHFDLHRTAIQSRALWIERDADPAVAAEALSAIPAQCR